MKRHLFSAVASAVLLAAFVPAHAATESSNFDVTVTLTSVCQAQTVGAVLDFGTYTAFGSTHTAAPTVTLDFKCTRGLTPALSFDVAGGGANGVVAGLNYTLSAVAALSTTGGPATPGVAGGFDVHRVTVTGGMPANQAGDDTASTTDMRTLTVTY